MAEKTIYLDYNATTPIHPEVAETMRPFLETIFGNPSSTHQYGTEAQKAVIKARQQVADSIGAHPDEIVFTSGGTEANNFAIKGIAYKLKHKGHHIITSVIEHPAVLEVCHFLEKEGFDVSYIPVDEYAIINPVEIEKAIRPDTILITIMTANNEVGTLQPISDIGKIAKEKSIIFHSDAAQAVGKIPVQVDKLNVDLLSIAGHKLYGPKGIGALYIRRGVELEKIIHGANHEGNKRAGTENILEIAGLGKACELVSLELQATIKHSQVLRDKLWSGLSNRFPDIKRNGHPEKVLANTLNVSIPDVEANTLLDELSGIAASAGAACHADTVDVSTVIEAMNIPMTYAMGTIRLSVGRMTSEDDIDKAIDLIAKGIQKLRGGESEFQDERESVKLTQFTHGLGCACKLRPQVLESVLKDFPIIQDERILSDLKGNDDAAVYKINDDIALVQTVDFFTPIVDNPYDFGAIAAANSLSDIYAMGAEPIFALNVVGFPAKRLPESVLKDILAGARDKAGEAGIHILGGHTVEDTEPKFGMVVSGVVHPDKLIRNSTAQPGDVLILTKALGVGIAATAMKRGLASDTLTKNVISLMSTLNKKAADIMKNHSISACTDVTGFGLLGHLKEMLEASQVSATLFKSEIPVLDDIYTLAASGIIPGGSKDNLSFCQPVLHWADGISEIDRLILSDAQTSGGLLISLPENESKKLVAQLRQEGIINACIIGHVFKGDKPIIKIEK